MSRLNQLGFFDLANRYDALSQQGNPLERLAILSPGPACALRWKRRYGAPTGRRAAGPRLMRC